jgi:hypothetical protein
MKLVTDCLKYTFTRNVLFNIQYILYLLPMYCVYILTQATLFCINKNIILIGCITMRYTTTYSNIILNRPTKL